MLRLFLMVGNARYGNFPVEIEIVGGFRLCDLGLQREDVEAVRLLYYPASVVQKGVHPLSGATYIDS